MTATLTGLTPNTPYFFRVVATSAGGTTDGAILSFTTPAAVTPVATTITATAGTPQSAMVNTAFATALQATVTDQNGNPFSGATVTFTAPASGSGGTFPGDLTTVTATTNASGVAMAPTFTANATAGSYAVTASVAGVATPASFNLTNTPAAPAGIQFASSVFTANVTEGTTQVVFTRAGNLSATVTVVVSSPRGHEVAAEAEDRNGAAAPVQRCPRRHWEPRRLPASDRQDQEGRHDLHQERALGRLQRHADGRDTPSLRQVAPVPAQSTSGHRDRSP